MNELEALVILRHIPGLGPCKVRSLLHAFGSPVGILQADTDQISALNSFGPQLAHAIAGWRQLSAWQQDLRLVETHGVDLIAQDDPRYPQGLKDLNDAPLYLYVKGELKAKEPQGLAVIGTRQASMYGRQVARQFSQMLAAHGHTIVSGLARGIDTEAHEGALQSGRTIAVIGSGLAELYPPENRELAGKIVQNGAVISEFPMQMPPDRQSFPQRNRLVAAMTKGCLLIEAPIKSGAMITMRKAKALKRKCFAIPGRVDHENFRGNHALLKSGEALYVEQVGDILAAYEDLFSLPSPQSQKKNPQSDIQLNPDEHQLLELMDVDEQTVDELKQRSGLPIAKLNILLMSLMIKRKIRELPGKQYAKVS